MGWSARVRTLALYLAAVVGVLLIVVSVSASRTEDDAMNRAAAAMDDHRNTTASGYRLLQLMLDAESSQRGLLLTGHAAYREDLEVARQALGPELRRLGTLTEDDAVQRARVVVLRTLVDRQIGALLEQAGEPTPPRWRAGAGIPPGHEHVTMEEFRRIVDHVAASAAQSADVRREHAREAAARSSTIGRVAASALLVLLVGFVVLAAQRGRMARSREAAESDRGKLADELAQLATHDALTGLPNRTLLEDRIDQALRRTVRDQKALAVLWVALDGFRQVNDAHGHVAGDSALVDVAQRLLAQVRQTDTVARVGGDEFVVLCEDVPADAGASGAVARIEAALRRSPLLVAGRSVPVTASIGIAVARHDGAGGDGLPLTTPGSLLAAASAAMRQAKESGRAQSRTYDAAAASAQSERYQLLADLRQAVESEQLWVAYQTLVDLTSEKVIGVEALVRWDHPTRGPVPPERFIPLAEDSRLIVAIGAFVLRQACAQTAAWNRDRARDGLPPIKASVNVSTRQLAVPGFVGTVTGALRASGLSPRLLTLEVTESVLLEGAHGAIEQLEDLAALGVTLALDDFGTGYSSLAYLRRLPIHVIKIDRSFVTGLGQTSADDVIIRTIIGLARNLDRAVLAEGIETAEQARRLRDMGCGFGQGYHYGQPATAAAVGSVLRRRAAARV